MVPSIQSISVIYVSWLPLLLGSEERPAPNSRGRAPKVQWWLPSSGVRSGRESREAGAGRPRRCDLHIRPPIKSARQICSRRADTAPASGLLMMEFLFWFMKPDNISAAHYILLCGQTHGVFQSWQLRFPGTPDAFLKSMGLFFTLWKVKQYSAKSSLIWGGICKIAIFVATYRLFLPLIRQNSLWIRNGFGKSWCVAEAIGSCVAQSCDCTWNLREEKPFIALQTLLFAWGFSNCGLWNIRPSRFIDGGYLKYKDLLKRCAYPGFFLSTVDPWTQGLGAWTLLSHQCS